MDSAALLYADETYAINRCIYDVYDAMPRYAEEALYQEALEIALADAAIPLNRRKRYSQSSMDEKWCIHTVRT